MSGLSSIHIKYEQRMTASRKIKSHHFNLLEIERKKKKLPEYAVT
tara:strand:- start:1910 stop:2044 length:135 start_codon:yes stop_codon:yes gene_type:complete